jgi:hypothetical protein
MTMPKKDDTTPCGTVTEMSRGAAIGDEAVCKWSILLAMEHSNQIFGASCLCQLK